MLTASGATFGFMPTVPHMLGISFGFPAMLLAMALGAGEVLRAAPWLYGVLRWAGAAYLLWLAWRIATARPQDDEEGVVLRQGDRQLDDVPDAVRQPAAAPAGLRLVRIAVREGRVVGERQPRHRVPGPVRGG